MSAAQHAIAIRAEMPGDEAIIHALTEAAFRDMPFSDGDEQDLVDRLRRDGDLTLSGIGGALIRRGIAELRSTGAKGIVLLGSNQYYPRFGFVHEPQLTYPGPPPEYFQCLLLDGELPSGEVRFAPAFG